ncbi:MAG TPA: DNA gyrase/topoisomerase IV subunit A, partial [Porphyromonadaceae bacterium]|nr:DNA gyrase/topoisomerase IV subunit A [Porphyromonadaceae bacterium]
ADQGYAYLKRFTFEATEKALNFLGENSASQLFLLTDVVYPRVKVVFGGNDDFREPLEIDVEEFITVKSYKAKGKRISNYEVKTVEELEPLRFPEPDPEPQETMKVEIDEENGESTLSDADLRDEIIGQMKLFD